MEALRGLILVALVWAVVFALAFAGMGGGILQGALLVAIGVAGYWVWIWIILPIASLIDRKTRGAMAKHYNLDEEDKQ